MFKDELLSLMDNTFTGIELSDLENAGIFPEKRGFRKGKVRDVITTDKGLLIVTSDRISAFDRVLTTIPGKGEVLNRIALFWFDRTKDIIANHILSEVSPRTVEVASCTVLPVEIIVRGYLTGSAWRDYIAGCDISGIKLPAGMKNNQKFETPLITPSTKEEMGGHDQPVSGKEIVRQGLVEASLWKEVEEKALALFARGSEIAAGNGLILVDTKYEFGILDGKLILVDEVHTPDSSRFWYADTYKELFEQGNDQRKLDKEYLRQWLMERGFMGDGEAPVIPDDIKAEVALRYIKAFEEITGTEFHINSQKPEAELKKILSYIKG